MKIIWKGKRPNCKNCIYCLKGKLCTISKHKIETDAERAFSCKYFNEIEENKEE